MTPIGSSGSSLTYPGLTMPTSPAVMRLAPNGAKDAEASEVRMSAAAEGEHALNLKV
jgi:hypothetical protein